MSVAFLEEGTFQGEGGGGAWGRSQVLQRWAAHKGGRSDRFKFFLNG